MGDSNATIGEARDRNIVGKYGLGKRNKRESILFKFCKTIKLVIENTWHLFKTPQTLRSAWISQDMKMSVRMHNGTAKVIESDFEIYDTANTKYNRKIE